MTIVVSFRATQMRAIKQLDHNQTQISSIQCFTTYILLYYSPKPPKIKIEKRNKLDDTSEILDKIKQKFHLKNMKRGEDNRIDTVNPSLYNFQLNKDGTLIVNYLANNCE